jgi:GT2 family glycosyltransferase
VAAPTVTVAANQEPGTQNREPEISVIIVTWNGRPYLEACLTAAVAQEGVSAEIIVVDNASADGTVEFVRAHYPRVRLVALAENRGFAGGNNAGAREARGTFLAFLNNDTVPLAGWLRALREGIDAGRRILLTTSRIVYMHDPEVIDSAGDGLLRGGGAFKRHHGESAHAAARSEEVFGVCGAACMMPKAVFDELGGFDEDFFASHEDVDLSYRARLRGYHCRYVADAIVKHHGSATLGKASAFAVFYGQRNLEWVYVKNTPISLLIRTLPSHMVYNAAAAAHFLRLGLFRTFLSAKAAALAGLPAMLKKRAGIQKARTVGATGIEPHLQRRWFAAKLREKRFDVALAREAR